MNFILLVLTILTMPYIFRVFITYIESIGKEVVQLWLWSCNSERFLQEFTMTVGWIVIEYSSLIALLWRDLQILHLFDVIVEEVL